MGWQVPAASEVCGSFPAQPGRQQLANLDQFLERVGRGCVSQEGPFSSECMVSLASAQPTPPEAAWPCSMGSSNLPRPLFSKWAPEVFRLLMQWLSSTCSSWSPRNWACPPNRFKRAQPALPKDLISRVWALRSPGADRKGIDTPKLSPFLSFHSVDLPTSPAQRSGVEERSHPAAIPELTREPTGASLWRLPRLWVH